MEADCRPRPLKQFGVSVPSTGSNDHGGRGRAALLPLRSVFQYPQPGRMIMEPLSSAPTMQIVVFQYPQPGRMIMEDFGVYAAAGLVMFQYPQPGRMIMELAKLNGTTFSQRSFSTLNRVE